MSFARGKKSFLSSSRSTALLLAGIYILFHLYFAALPEIGGSSEAREGQVVWSIIHHHDWILPLRNGIVPSKPPLFHWIGAVFAFLLGFISPWVVRLPSIFAGGALVYATLRFVQNSYAKLQGKGREIPPTLTYFVWIILVTSYCFFANTGDAKVDMVFSLWTTLAIVGWIQEVIYNQTISSERRGFFLFFFAISLAALTKGPLGIVLPCLICFSIAVFLFGFRRSLSLWFTPRVSWLLPIIITLPWYLLAFFRGGDQFTKRQLFFENIKRVLGGEDINTEVWWFYLPSFLRTSFPWSIIFIVLVYQSLKKIRKTPGRTVHENERLPFIGAVWVIVGILFFSIPAGKRHSYLLPLMPGFAVFLALFVFTETNALIERAQEILSKFVPYITEILFVLYFIFLGALFVSGKLPFLAGGRIEVMSAARWIYSQRVYLSLGFLLLCSIGYFVSSRDILPKGMVQSIFFLFFLYQIYYLGQGVKAELKNFYGTAYMIKKQTGEEPLTIVKKSLDEYFDPVQFYLGRDVSLIAELDHCSPGWYLFRNPSLIENSEGLVEVARYNEISKGKDENEIVLARCN